MVEFRTELSVTDIFWTVIYPKSDINTANAAEEIFVSYTSSFNNIF